MSSSDEVSVWGADLGPEGGEQGGGRRGPTPGLDVPAPQSGESEGGLPVREGLQAEREVIEKPGAALRGQEGRPGSPVDEKDDALDLTPHLAEESAAIAKQPIDPGTPEVQRNPSAESCTLQMASIWVELDESPNSGSAPSTSEESQWASPGGRAWGKPRRGYKSRLNIPVNLQRPSKEDIVGPPSDPESSDDFSEIQMMKVNIYPKEGSQAVSSSREDPGDTPRRLNLQVRENVFQGTGSFQASTLRRLTSATDRQLVGELELSSSKKMPSVVSGKRSNRPSYIGAAVAGGLPCTTTKKKVSQEKKSGSGASKGALGRKYQAFPTWGQRVSGGNLVPATFPPISGLPLPGRSKRYSLVDLATKQPKHSNPGKKSVAGRTRESELVAEDNDPSGEPVLRGQLSTKRPGTSCLSKHRGEFSSGDPKTRVPQVLGSSPALALSPGGINPRGPTPLGHQEPLDLFPRHERQRQPSEAQGCPGCFERQKEIDDLKRQLEVLQSLTDEFQAL
ncbi:uncharacterized protein CXorf49 homolog [Tamandua tetradactyla]|uniref:uncharacterized protein CXorf49 homolog n=1 Tax=Tamandua tetradactyla TaxID=48850 RepID=UPI00405471E6